MAPIRYSLHYEDYSEHLMSRFGKLLQMQSLVDMTLMCSSHTLRVHKAVLAASSAYFQEVLQKQTGEPLIILKMRFSVLKCLVEFMYCGKTQCLEDNLDELVSAAQFLKIKGLSKVTKEGLGISNHSELPVFTPPVVINRPPQSLIDLQTQDINNLKPAPQLAQATSTSQQVDALGRPNDMVMRLPFNIEEGGGAAATAADYGDNPRAVKPRRGRPSVRRTSGWGGPGALGRAAERALMRREQDSRKAIHQLKHLQTRHMQDYMDRVSLSQAVNSICGPETPSHNYLSMDSDLMYADQAVASNVLDPTISYAKDHSLASDPITSNYSNATATSASTENSTSGISTAMSQYVNALKNAGLPTDLPILFESGDGSYINVNEQVLLDMVQSSEIQYEVIEQPNIIEKVADPSEIKSIDDLSKSIERGEMMMSNKSYSSAGNFGKHTQFNQHDDTINSLNAILPDNLEPFAEQQNYVVLDPRLQENNSSMDHVIANDFCIDGDMQFFTKSMSDDVKKYYEEQQLNDQFCPTSTSFSISLLDTKNPHLVENGEQHFNPLNSEDLRRNEDCYDFGLQLPQTTEDDALDCLMSTPKPSEHAEDPLNLNTELDKDTEQRNHITYQEQEELIKDLMDIENKIDVENMQENRQTETNNESHKDSDCAQDYNVNINVGFDINDNDENDKQLDLARDLTEKNTVNTSEAMTSSSMHWDHINENIDNDVNQNENNSVEPGPDFSDSVIDLTQPNKPKKDWSDSISIDNEKTENKENECPSEKNRDCDTNSTLEECPSEKNRDCDTNSTLEDNIPYAVGLLPLKQIHENEGDKLLKRKSPKDDGLVNDVDAKCLKRKVKHKII